MDGSPPAPPAPPDVNPVNWAWGESLDALGARPTAADGWECQYVENQQLFNAWADANPGIMDWDEAHRAWACTLT